MSDRLRLVTSEKQSDKDTKRIDDGITAIYDNLLECKCIIPNPLETFSFLFILLKGFNISQNFVIGRATLKYDFYCFT